MGKMPRPHGLGFQPMAQGRYLREDLGSFSGHVAKPQLCRESGNSVRHHREDGAKAKCSDDMKWGKKMDATPVAPLLPIAPLPSEHGIAEEIHRSCPTDMPVLQRRQCLNSGEDLFWKLDRPRM